ncbi:MAG: hypothetical protein J6U64_06210, partial [Alphaproteobacteria bacterium]|nr:hypothetical protein [Alphaproteobacteria bacterium]
ADADDDDDDEDKDPMDPCNCEPKYGFQCGSQTINLEICCNENLHVGGCHWDGCQSEESVRAALEDCKNGVPTQNGQNRSDYVSQKISSENKVQQTSQLNIQSFSLKNDNSIEGCFNLCECGEYILTINTVTGEKEEECRSSCPEDQTCCGSKTNCYDPSVNSCCGGIIYPSNSGQKCCSGVLYNPDTQVCCGFGFGASLVDKCSEGKELDDFTCTCRCPKGQVECDGKCIEPPECDEDKCEELSEDQCTCVAKCSDEQECCGKECIEKCKKEECQICDGEGGCKSSCGTEETCCGGNCIENCTRGQTLNLKTCICECPDGQVLCDGACKDAPTCDESKCEKLSEDKCSCVSKCSEQEACQSGQCVNMCGGTTCGAGEKCVAYSTRYWEGEDESGKELWGTESYSMCCPEDSTPTRIDFNVDKTGAFVTECCYSEPFIDIYDDGEDGAYDSNGYWCCMERGHTPMPRCFKINWKEGATTGPCAKYHECYGEGDTPIVYEGEIDCKSCSN